MQTIIAGVLAGALISYTFRVWAVLPATAVGGAVVTSIELAQGASIISAIASFCIALVTLELGYSAGILLQAAGSSADLKHHSQVSRL